MTGFKPGTAGVETNCVANFYPTTSIIFFKFFFTGGVFTELLLSIERKKINLM